MGSEGAQPPNTRHPGQGASSASGAADLEPSEARAEGHACGTHEVIHSPFEGERTPRTHLSIGAWIPDRLPTAVGT